jgi:DNA-binding response OmpR family regulator
MSESPRPPARDGEQGILHVLVVEDDAVDRRAIKRALKEAPIEVTVTEAPTLEDAEHLLSQHRYDCALLDMHLPGGPGTSLLGLLGSTPGVILTGERDDRNASDALKLGADDYLLKSDIRPHTLTRAIRYAVDRRQARRAADVVRLAGGVADRVGNPATAIRLNLQMAQSSLRRGDIDIEELRVLVEEAQTSLDEMVSIIRQLQDHAQGKAGWPDWADDQHP